MDLGQLKTQIMTMFMMKSANSQNKEKGGYEEIFVILYSMALMSTIEFVFKHLPALVLMTQAYIKKRMEKKMDWVPMIETKKVEDISSVTLVRVYDTQANSQKQMDNVYTEKVDAILEYICALDNAKHVKIDVRCALNNTDEIQLTPLIKAKVKSTGGGEGGSAIEIALYSNVLKVSELRAWIDDIHANYVYDRANKLGNKTYYFNEVPIEPIKQHNIGHKNPDGSQEPSSFSYRWEHAPKHLQFQMNEFKTSKSFSNVYGDHVIELKERLDLFMKHPEWYMERGIPHSLGILLHGVPGAGKTSTIKAIAKDTNRHIFNLSLREYTSQSQLTNLFFNETVHIHTSETQKVTYKIPLNRRVYVIEDIDCLTNVVLDRQMYPREEAQEGDAVTLSFLLNLLDGVLETPGRILVITSNYPDCLDKALIRPGRIDVKIKFDYANREFIQSTVNSFYSMNMPMEKIPEELGGVFTPAEVMESLCTHFKNPDAALNHMIEKRQSVLESRQNMLRSHLVSDSESSSLGDTGTDTDNEGTSIEMLEAQECSNHTDQATELQKVIDLISRVKGISGKDYADKKDSESSNTITNDIESSKSKFIS